jgi:hypothetical protein
MKEEAQHRAAQHKCGKNGQDKLSHMKTARTTNVWPVIGQHVVQQRPFFRVMAPRASPNAHLAAHCRRSLRI